MTLSTIYNLNKHGPGGGACSSDNADTQVAAEALQEGSRFISQFLGIVDLKVKANGSDTGYGLQDQPVAAGEIFQPHRCSEPSKGISIVDDESEAHDCASGGTEAGGHMLGLTAWAARERESRPPRFLIVGLRLFTCPADLRSAFAAG